MLPVKNMEFSVLCDGFLLIDAALDHFKIEQNSFQLLWWEINDFVSTKQSNTRWSKQDNMENELL